MLKKTIMGLVLTIASLSMAHAGTINYQGTGNYEQVGGNVLGSTITDVSLNQGMAFNNSDTSALLGHGGFDSFSLNVGESLHFWYNEVAGGALVDLYGEISSIDPNSFIGNTFSFFGLNSNTGSIYEVSGSTSFDGNGNVISNSINVSGQHATVPEPGSIALMGLGIIGLTGMRKLRDSESQDMGIATT